ncbi:hypothetical protein [Gottfriedia solisilvae]|uniref:Uncharacterized protein n=1 Tax=Gottfriedia solisilvae TaxID=1516104 RepID=A0A8J3EW18_9BACI|nr:hypothetical protein [Gottfriedia solisilvae]GGI13595.1 hypothetical protein GCM10007380_18700 [Gottfriedia solisilvae]
MSSSIFFKKKKRSAVLLDKHHSIRLLKTNKKRIVNKRNNKIKGFEQILVKELNDEMISTSNSTVNEISEQKGNITIEKLPVTFLLKLGKEFFSDLEAVKYYYNSNQENYYKNRSLLEETLQSSINQSSEDVQAKIAEFIANK